MRQRHHPSSSGEDTLFNDSDDQLDLARNALTRNNPEAALKHYLAAHEAQQRQDVINEVFQQAGYLAREPQDRLLMAEYYLAVAELTGNDEQILPALDASLDVANKATKVRSGEKVDHERIASIAIGIFRFAPDNVIGSIKKMAAVELINKQITTLLEQDDLRGSSRTKAFLLTETVRRAIQEQNPILTGILNGFMARVFKTEAGVLGLNRPGDVLDRRNARLWLDTPANDKPYLN